MAATIDFKALRATSFPDGAVVTGSPPLDRFLAHALATQLPPSIQYGKEDAAALQEIAPLRVLKTEPAESLGRAILINSFVLSRLWWIHSKHADRDRMIRAHEIFRFVSEALDHARISAEDASALMRDLPELLAEGALEYFARLFIASFPNDIPAPLRAVTQDFLDRVITFDIAKHHAAETIIAAHLRLMSHLGREPLGLPFYRERAEMIAWSLRVRAELLQTLGPVHCSTIHRAGETRPRLTPAEQDALRGLMAAQTPQERGRMVADECALRLPSAFSDTVAAWGYVQLPFRGGSWLHLDLNALVKRSLVLSADQACTILTYFLDVAPCFQSGLTLPAAKTLARYLPRNRPDLVQKVKETRKADAKAKKILLDALLGPANDADPVLAARRQSLLAQIATEPVFGAADPASARVPDWGAIKGQFIMVDVMGYAKAVALAQSAGADVTGPIADLQAIDAVARANLAALKIAPAPANVYEPELSPAIREALKTGTDEAIHALPTIKERDLAHSMLNSGGRPSCTNHRAHHFGNSSNPTRKELVQYEERLIAALGAMLDRLLLLQANPTLVAFEREMVTSLTNAKPTARLRETCKTGPLPPALLQRVAEFQPNLLDGPYWSETEPLFPAAEQAAVRLAIWALHGFAAHEAVPVLEAVAARSFLGPAKAGLQHETLGNAAIWALEALPDGGGLVALSRLVSRVRHPKVRARIEESLTRAATAAGVTRQRLDELCVPDHEMVEGLRCEGAARLAHDGRGIVLTWLSADGRETRSPPKAMAAEDVSAAKALAKEITADLATQTRRLEALYLADARWDSDVWRHCYADHGTVALLARRLLWEVRWPDRSAVILPVAGGAVDRTGARVDLSRGEIRLWHPLMSPPEEARAWRDRLSDLQLRQPFRQVWRETYQLTGAECATNDYSNRFAGHILRQHQMLSLAHQQGWTCSHRMWVDAPEDKPTHILLPAHDLQAEFWAYGAGGDSPPVSDAQAYLYLGTDRLCFHRLDRNAPFGRGESQSLEAVPPVVLSEILRHCDLFTSVASVALDPEWLDRGPAAGHSGTWQDEVANRYWHEGATRDLTGMGRIRHEMLAKLLPLLAQSAAFSLTATHLLVKGVRNSYLIHLGSAAVTIQGSLSHVCIVPKPQPATAPLLPFEGDTIFAVILSKALMLARDDLITDPVILRQI